MFKAYFKSIQTFQNVSHIFQGGADGLDCLKVDYTIIGPSVYNLQPVFTTKSTFTNDNEDLQLTTTHEQIYTIILINNTIISAKKEFLY